VQSRPRSDEFEKTRKESYAVYRKYQLAIHKDDPNDCEEKQVCGGVDFVYFQIDFVFVDGHIINF